MFDNWFQGFSTSYELFSFFLIISVIRDAYEKEYPGKAFEYPCPARVRDIIYDFKYSHFSHDAMIAFVETFADCHGVGINAILKHTNHRKDFSS